MMWLTLPKVLFRLDALTSPFPWGRWGRNRAACGSLKVVSPRSATSCASGGRKDPGRRIQRGPRPPTTGGEVVVLVFLVRGITSEEVWALCCFFPGQGLARDSRVRILDEGVEAGPQPWREVTVMPTYIFECLVHLERDVFTCKMTAPPLKQLRLAKVLAMASPLKADHLLHSLAASVASTSCPLPLNTAFVQEKS
jgi:hypothetical protein